MVQVLYLQCLRHCWTGALEVSREVQIRKLLVIIMQTLYETGLISIAGRLILCLITFWYRRCPLRQIRALLRQE